MRTVILFLSLFLLTACGNKAPLTLPSDDNNKAAKPSAEAAR